MIEGAAETANRIISSGGRAVALQASIADRAQVKAAVHELRRKLGPITILVNNAGIAEFVPFKELTDAQWDRMMEVNLKGTFIVTQEVLPIWRRSLGPDREYLFLERAVRFRADGSLFCLEGRHHRADQDFGARVRSARHHLQQHSAALRDEHRHVGTSRAER